MVRYFHIRLACALAAVLASGLVLAEARDVVIGVNASMGSMSEEQQNAIRGALKAAGVHDIRAGIGAMTQESILRREPWPAKVIQ